MNDPERQPDPAEPTNAPRRWRWLLIVTFLVLLVPGWLLYNYYAGIRRLERAMAEADRLDPGSWFEELEAKRAVVPDEENSALLIMKLAKMIAPLTRGWEGEEGNIFDPELLHAHQLSEKQIAWLREGLEKFGPALREARKLLDMPRGRYPIQWHPDNPWKTVLHVQDPRSVSSLFRWECLMRAEEGDINGAMDSCRGIINTASSIGDEPTLISLLVRIAIQSLAVGSIERTLAQGEASLESLQTLQQRLEQEAKEPILLIGMRGERVSTHQLLLAIKAGRMSVDDVQQAKLGVSGTDLSSGISAYLTGLTLHHTHGDILQYLNEAVEIAKLPVEQQRPLIERLEASLRDRSKMVATLAPPLEKVFMASLRIQATLRCAIVALAAERYRLVHGQWPQSVDKLVPEFLSEAPADPFGNGPLKLIRVDDGLAIYSVSLDGEDNSGKFGGSRWMDKGHDLGFRLWDVKHRRQPPMKEEKDDERIPKDDP